MTTQLSLCPLDYQDVINLGKFGTTSEATCEYSLSTLTATDPDKLPVEANVFFDLFLEDADGNLVDVPVLIMNYRDLENQTVNSDEVLLTGSSIG